MMNSAQKAVVSAARKDGLSPMEIASELMNHDITEVVLGFMRKREVAFNKLSEQEQDSVIAELGSELKKITATACRVINANGAESVGATLKSLKIDGKLTATMVIDGDEPNRHVLTDKAHDKSSILIVLYPNSYAEGMSAHQGEKDQKALPLDVEQDVAPAKADKKTPRVSSPTSAATIAKKAIELPPKLLEDARAFIDNQQVVTVSGVQNQLKIGALKAVAVMEQMCEEGLVEFVGDEKSGEYRKVHAKPNDPEPAAKPSKAKATKAKAVDPVDEALADLTFDGEPDAPGDAQPVVTTLTDDLYDQIKAKVIKDNKVSVGALSIAFDVDGEVVEQAVERLEMEGVISEENEMGMHEVITA